MATCEVVTALQWWWVSARVTDAEPVTAGDETIVPDEVAVEWRKSGDGPWEVSTLRVVRNSPLKCVYLSGKAEDTPRWVLEFVTAHAPSPGAIVADGPATTTSGDRSPTNML